MRFLDLGPIELDAQPRRLGHLDAPTDDLQRLLREALAVLPDPVRIDRRHAARRGGKGILCREVKPSKCHKGWVYSMMDVITNVQPRFKLAYESGAQFLAIAVDDREGARLIFEKGLKLYPNNWKLNFDAAYLYLWELKDAERASELLYQAMKNGGPEYLPSLVASIYSEIGQAQFARHLLMDSLQKELHPGVRDRLLERLKEVDKVLKKVQ